VYGATAGGASNGNDTTVGYTMRVYVTQRARTATADADDLLDDSAALLREFDFIDYEEDSVEKSSSGMGDFFERLLSLIAQIVQVLLHILVEVM
jgi:hypothetical protein